MVSPSPTCVSPFLSLVSARSIDLTRPLDEESMKKEAVPYYTVSMQRKATAVVRSVNSAKAPAERSAKVGSFTPVADGSR